MTSSHHEAPPKECVDCGALYTVGPGVQRAASVWAYEPRPGDPAFRPLQVYTLDPASLQREGATAVLQVPYEPLEPGPKGCVFEVDGSDTAAEAQGALPNEPLDLENPRVLITQGLRPSPANPHFRSQMVYAVSSSVYSAFRAALGRHLAWGFDRPDEHGITRLRIRPHAAEEGRNAAYDRLKAEIRFGYFPSPAGLPKGRNVPNGPSYTCLSHDIIAHETTHALIDGMRSQFLIPTGPDVLGFHEGFADLVAVVKHFSYEQVIESQLRRSHNELKDAPLLMGIAQAFGLALGKPGVLRSAVDDDGKPRIYSPNLEAHEMGAVLLAAIFDAFQVVYQRKSERYLRLATQGTGMLPPGALPDALVSLLADQARGLANQFLAICVRALDYCPPVEITLGEFLRAMITADHDLVPEDPWAYREALIDAFAARGIYPDKVSHLSEDALLWQELPVKLPNVNRLSFAELRFAGDPASPASKEELMTQACVLGSVVTQPEAYALFGLTGPWDPKLAGGQAGLPCVQSVRTSRRVGPNGQVVFDLVAEVTQRRLVRDEVTGRIHEFSGGATIILGPKGEFRYVISKSVLNAERLQRQLEYQRKSPYWQPRGGRMRLVPNVLRIVHGRQGEATLALD